MSRNDNGLKWKVKITCCWCCRGKLCANFLTFQHRKQAKSITEPHKKNVLKEKNDSTIKQENSMVIYECLSKHLNLLQLYIRETPFHLENRTSPLLDVVSNCKNFFDLFNSRTQINAHPEIQICQCYKTALAYLDTKRDPEHNPVFPYTDYQF